MNISVSVGAAGDDVRSGAILDHKDGGQRYRVIDDVPSTNPSGRPGPKIYLVEIVAGTCVGELRMMMADALIPAVGELAA